MPLLLKIPTLTFISNFSNSHFIMGTFLFFSRLFSRCSNYYLYSSFHLDFCLYSSPLYFSHLTFFPEKQTVTIILIQITIRIKMSFGPSRLLIKMLKYLSIATSKAEMRVPNIRNFPVPHFLTRSCHSYHISAPIIDNTLSVYPKTHCSHISAPIIDITLSVCPNTHISHIWELISAP